MNYFKKFSIYYLSFLVALCSIIILLNWLVNPYNIYKSLPIQRFSQKPVVTSHLRLAKAMAVEWNKPDVLILGSSTAETGLNPQFPAWNNSRVYNLGLSGANIYEVMRYLQHAESIKPVKKVVLAVNFFMFNAYINNRDDFDESILRVDVQGKNNPLALNNVFTTLLSYDAIKASLETISSQNKKNAFQSNGQLVLNYREDQVNQLKGYKNNFLYTERFNKSSLLPPPHELFGFTNKEQQINTLQYMQNIIAICEKNNTQLILVIAPEHIRLLETYKQLGLWNLYEQWQKELVDMIDLHNKNHPNVPFELWGFNKVNAITTEQLPEKEDTHTAMHWFWDPYHFKNELGNLILSSILNNKDESQTNNFSTRLTPINIYSELQFNRTALSRWENEHLSEVSELKENLSASSKDG
ncbi:hypothetical protein [Legionella quateirensis]|uniref:Uncharacterized protein n=1 Tax=Legionella quateirensis TaxID=45072 RepID=A0A378KW69_9GAMM|nr:hypothetical protein [Legionella quateirensis]KTD47609.1 hypothetical protein Lqua_2002 [Legionella quateirensis]STY18636.1 Uncharacterised protein [Legionella quateirensis]